MCDMCYHSSANMTKKEEKNKEEQGDIISDDIVFEEEGEYSADTIKKLREKLKKCTAENKEYLDGWQRAKADFTNLKKDTEKQKQNFVKFAKEDLLSEILPVLDSFEMAFANKEAWEKVDKSWRSGVEYIHGQLKTVFENNGIVEISPLGDTFDPNKHNSIELVDTDDEQKDDTVVEVVQKGYMLNEKVMRPARVKVARFKK